MNYLILKIFRLIGFEPIRHTLRDMVSNIKMDPNCVNWTPAVRNCLITECPEHIDDPESYADCKLDPHRIGSNTALGTGCTKRRTRAWSYKSKTFMTIGERAERYKKGLNIGLGQPFMYGDDVWNCTDKCRAHHAKHSTGCTCPQDHIKKQLHVEEDGNIYKKSITKLKVENPYNKILKQSRSLVPGEQIEIPHHIMLAIMRTQHPKTTEYVLTYQDLREFADSFEKLCEAKLTFKDGIHVWIMCKE